MHNSPSAAETFRDASDTVRILQLLGLLMSSFSLFFFQNVFGCFLGGLTGPLFNLTEGQGRLLPFLIDGR